MLDQFAHRYTAAPVTQGPAAAQIRLLHWQLPDWDFVDHDVVLAESLAPLNRQRDPIVGALERL